MPKVPATAPRRTLNLALAFGRSYFRAMKPISIFLTGAACSTLLLFSALAQENPARANVEREAAEENYKLLSSAVNGLTTGQADLQRRLGALADEIRALRAQDNKIDTSKFVTREELNRLVESVKEIDRKREADKKLILDEFEELKKDLRKMLSAPVATPPAASPKKSKSPSASDKGSEKLTAKPPGEIGKSSEAAGTNQEGVYYVVQAGNNLLAIVKAHNDEFKKQGKKTTLQLVRDGNPGLKDTNLRVGQKIFIPLAPE
jgi:hypothetical protein